MRPVLGPFEYERQHEEVKLRRKMGDSVCHSPTVKLLAGLVGVALSITGLVWCFASPPLGSKLITSPPAMALSTNDPYKSVYFGNGCFW